MRWTVLEPSLRGERGPRSRRNRSRGRHGLGGRARARGPGPAGARRHALGQGGCAGGCRAGGGRRRHSRRRSARVRGRGHRLPLRTAALHEVGRAVPPDDRRHPRRRGRGRRQARVRGQPVRVRAARRADDRGHAAAGAGKEGPSAYRDGQRTSPRARRRETAGHDRPRLRLLRPPGHHLDRRREHHEAAAARQAGALARLARPAAYAQTTSRTWPARS
jgi:hypothetical protein